MTLRYTFAEPVDLRTISLRNGYQKVRQRPGKPELDLFAANERVRAVKVITDHGQWTWQLKDSKLPQRLSRRFGTTRSVRLKVTSVYPSSRYPDLAICEITFSGLPPPPAG